VDSPHFYNPPYEFSKCFFAGYDLINNFPQPCQFNVFNLTHIWVISKLINFGTINKLNKFQCDFIDNPTISNIHSMDKTVNSFGRKLLQMCFNTGLNVANRRLCNDRSGNFSFCTNKGRSVSGYLLLSPNNFKMLSDFDVLQMNEFSDHMPLFFEFNFSVIHSRKVFPWYINI
jgi:hypothetical protein